MGCGDGGGSRTRQGRRLRMFGDKLSDKVENLEAEHDRLTARVEQLERLLDVKNAVRQWIDCDCEHCQTEATAPDGTVLCKSAGRLIAEYQRVESVE